MAIADPQGRVRAVDWFAESMRATVFPAPGTAVNVEAWWRQLTGGDPETRTIKPATREHLEEGPFEGRRLRLTINPLGVVQWQVQPPPPTGMPTEFFNVGLLHEILPNFVELIERWFPMSPRATRIAFGAVVILPLPGLREGYEMLGRFLRDSVRVDPERSSDFLYRINRPRASTTVDGLVINRLSTWNVLKMSVLAASPTGGDVGRIVHETYACRVELDINTAPTFQGTFDPPVGVRVFQELQRLGLEILEEGDVP